MSQPKGRNPYEARLRQRVSRFLNQSAPAQQVVERIREREWSACFFGPFVRELLIAGPSPVRLRTIEVVVDCSTAELRDAFGPLIADSPKSSRLQLNVGGALFEVWPLEQTWAYRQRLLECTGFTSLPRTAFLNVEAVAVGLNPPPKQPREVYEAGFYEAMETQILEINLEENPAPGKCVVRSLITAARLGYRIGSRLGAYIVRHGTRMSTADFAEAQRSQYGFVWCEEARLRRWVTAIQRQLWHSPTDPVRVPCGQMSLGLESALTISDEG